MVFKANSKKERTAKAMEKQVRLQKQQMRLQRPARTGGVFHATDSGIPAATWSSPPPPPVPQVAPWSLADELSKLAALRERGILTEEEFNEQKRRLLERH
jgi:hypothetical protein